MLKETSNTPEKSALVHACWLELASAWIDGKHDDIVGALISDQIASWINREIAWPVAFSRNMFDEREFARALVDLENDDAVVSTIRAVEKLARPRHAHQRNNSSH